VADFQLSRNVPESPFRVKTAEKANPDLLRRVRTLEEHSEQLIRAIKEQTGWEEVDFSDLEVVVAPPRCFRNRYLEQFADCSKLGLEEKISLGIRAWYFQFSILGACIFDANQVMLNSYFVSYRPPISILETLCHELIHYSQHKRFKQFFALQGQLRQALKIRPESKDDWLEFERLYKLIVGREAWMEAHAEYLSYLIIKDFETLLPKTRFTRLHRFSELIIFSLRSIIEPETTFELEAERAALSLIEHYCGQPYNRKFVDLMFENPCLIDVLFQPHGTLDIPVPDQLSHEETKKLVNDLISFRPDKGKAITSGQLTINLSGRSLF